MTTPEAAPRRVQDLEVLARLLGHDLRAPVRQLRQWAELAMISGGDGDMAGAMDALGRARDAAVTVDAMMVSLTELVRLGSDVELGPVDLDAVAAEVVAELSAEVAAAGATVTVGALGSVTGSAPLLARVLTELVGNSIRFAGDQPAVVTVDAERDAGRVTLVVADDGPGLVADLIPRATIPFWRGPDVPHDAPGLGIGLPVVLRAAEVMGGGLRLRREGEGLRAEVDLPAG
jgi:signal transduction histidine kinase